MGGVPAGCRLPSHLSRLGDLAVELPLGPADGARLRLGPGWAKRWTMRLATAAGEMTAPVADLSESPGPLTAAVPVRRFTWARRQRHRPGLQYLVCTGRHHGFESLAEQRLLLVLDFLGVTDVVSQPLELRLTTVDGWARHVPDFLVVARDGAWLVDVRPADRAGDDDRLRFAAAAEVAVTMGWRYVVVTGWRPQVVGVLDAVSAQRRPLPDPLGVRSELLQTAAAGPVEFATLTEAASWPVVARAHALHLIWHRQLAIDLAAPLGEHTLVWAVQSG
jgi:TnsA-like endonuclease N terminal